jgi:hypothetical protein
MKIGNENLNEIITGAFISEDKKTLVLDVFAFTNLDRSMSDDVIADKLSKCINDDCLKVYSDTVENIVFSCGEYLILNPKRISVDVENLRIVFSKLRAIACGSEIQLPNVLPVGIKVVDNYIIDDLACQAEEEGLKEKAEFYYRWEPVLDYYWGNYHLGQFLQKKNQAEFEECYKKIAGENDWFGDATSEYGVWLHKQGRYSKAIKYLMWATRAIVDTCNREYAMGVLCDSISQDCPYWKYFDEANFIKYLIYYLECDSTRDNSDIEKVLLERVSSENENIALTAKDQLSRLASTGVFLIENGENGYCDIFDYVKMKKAKEILSIEIEEDYDVEGMVSDLYYAFDGELDEKIAKAFENRLLAVECSEEFDYEGAGFSKIVLFQLYFDGKYVDDQITLVAPSLMDKQKLAALFRYEFVMNTEINFTFELARDEGDLDDILELAYSLYPEKDLIVRNWAERCAIKQDTDKLGAIISSANEQLASYIALDLFDEWDYYFENEECAENIEKILIALSKKGVHPEFLLSLYQFGRAKIESSLGAYEVELPSLQNEEKALLFSNKHGIKLLSAPAEIEL